MNMSGREHYCMHSLMGIKTLMEATDDEWPP